MKKAGFRLLSRADLSVESRIGIQSTHGDKTMKIEVSIIASCAPYVKQNPQKRFVRESLPPQAITPALTHIAKQQRRRQSVRVPAMRGSEWGQLLRALELKRAFA